MNREKEAKLIGLATLFSILTSEGLMCQSQYYFCRHYMQPILCMSGSDSIVLEATK